MSIKVMSRCWDTPCGSHTKKLVLLALADNANDGGECFPSMETIARKCDLSEQAVRNWIKEMEEEKWLVVDRSHKLKRSNIYALTPPTPLTPNAVDPQQGLPRPPTPLTPTPNAVDPNRQGTVKEPSLSQIQVQAEALWKAYPRKAGKKPGLKAIIKSLKSNKFEDLLKATHKFCAMWEGEPDKTFCPHAATWFNQERFNEDPTEWTRPHQGNGNGSRSFPVPRNDYEREVPPDQRY
jgi:hypothetical protein